MREDVGAVHGAHAKDDLEVVGDRDREAVGERGPAEPVDHSDLRGAGVDAIGGGGSGRRTTRTWGLPISIRRAAALTFALVTRLVSATTSLALAKSSPK